MWNNIINGNDGYFFLFIFVMFAAKMNQFEWKEFYKPMHQDDDDENAHNKKSIHFPLLCGALLAFTS